MPTMAHVSYYGPPATIPDPHLDLARHQARILEHAMASQGLPLSRRDSTPSMADLNPGNVIDVTRAERLAQPKALTSGADYPCQPPEPKRKRGRPGKKTAPPPPHPGSTGGAVATETPPHNILVCSAPFSRKFGPGEFLGMVESFLKRADEDRSPVTRGALARALGVRVSTLYDWEDQWGGKECGEYTVGMDLFLNAEAEYAERSLFELNNSKGAQFYLTNRKEKHWKETRRIDQGGGEMSALEVDFGDGRVVRFGRVRKSSGGEIE